jgi:hypothetical protein
MMKKKYTTTLVLLLIRDSENVTELMDQQLNS